MGGSVGNVLEAAFKSRNLANAASEARKLKAENGQFRAERNR